MPREFNPIIDSRDFFKREKQDRSNFEMLAFTDEEVEYMRKNRAGTDRELTENMNRKFGTNRTIFSVGGKRRKMGFKRSK